MRRYLPRLAMFASLALAVTACGSTTEARTGGWTHPSTSPAAEAAQPAVAAAQASPGQAEKITIEAFDLGFTPSMPTVPAAGTYQVEFKNTGSTLHDVTFADGTKISAEGGASATGTVTVPAAGLAFMCSIPGHADAGMKGEVMVAGAAPAAHRPALSPPGLRRRPSPIRTRPSTPSSMPRRPSSSRAPSMTSISRSSTRTSPSPRASSSRPGRSAARCQGRPCGCTSVTPSTST